jgi:hypothetical protein
VSEDPATDAQAALEHGEPEQDPEAAEADPPERAGYGHGVIVFIPKERQSTGDLAAARRA